MLPLPSRLWSGCGRSTENRVGEACPKTLRAGSGLRSGPHEASGAIRRKSGQTPLSLGLAKASLMAGVAGKFMLTFFGGIG
jgi:hypothetical protein